MQEEGFTAGVRKSESLQLLVSYKLPNSSTDSFNLHFFGLSLL